MNDLTVYSLKYFFENTLDLTGEVNDFEVFEENSIDYTRIFTCNIFNLRPQIVGSTVQRLVFVDNIEHNVVSIDHSDNSFVIQANLLEAVTYKVPNPYFFWGTPINANVELSNTPSSQKYSFVFLKEIIRERVFNKKAALDREAEIRLFLLDSMDKENWHTKQFYSEVLVGLNKLAREVIKQLEKDIGNFFLDETDYNLINHADFGLLIQDQKGYIQSLFSDTLSGVELSFTLPIKIGCKCCSKQSNKKENYMFQEHTFSTDVGETTKEIDFVANGKFTKTELGFIFQLFKFEGGVYKVVNLGIDAFTGSGFGSETVNAAFCNVNESTNIFSFAGLKESTTYKVNVIQRTV